MFINRYFSGNVDLLQQQIDDKLSEIIPIGINNERLRGNKNKYSLGTVVEIESDGVIFYLIALTHFDKDNKAFVSEVEYKCVLNNLFRYVDYNSPRLVINIPLIGTGVSKAIATQEQAIEQMHISMASIPNALYLDKSHIKIIVFG